MHLFQRLEELVEREKTVSQRDEEAKQRENVTKQELAKVIKRRDALLAAIAKAEDKVCMCTCVHVHRYTLTRTCSQNKICASYLHM